uniref:THAP-type domain-containing protein n=1 Tax=Esox lucius TaxID=8010 RepID=A0A3P8XU05_ESOLU
MSDPNVVIEPIYNSLPIDAPGCTNKFYTTEGVHYHVLPLKRQPVLQKWLVAMKHQSRPVQKIIFINLCSMPQGYPIPSAFNFTGYSVGNTDRPATKTSHSFQPTLQRKLISAACIRDLVLSVMTQSS